MFVKIHMHRTKKSTFVLQSYTKTRYINFLAFNLFIGISLIYIFPWLSSKHLWYHNSIRGSVTVGAQGPSKLSLIEEQVSPTCSILKSTMLHVMIISIPTSAPCLKYSKSTLATTEYYRDGISLQLKNKVYLVLSFQWLTGQLVAAKTLEILTDCLTPYVKLNLFQGFCQSQVTNFLNSTLQKNPQIWFFEKV